MIQSGKKYTDMAKRAGVSQNTFFCHCREPDRITIKELRAYVQEAKIPEEYVLNFIFQNRNERRWKYVKQPIIPIPRADEKLINALVESGILVVTEEGIKVNEKALR